MSTALSVSVKLPIKGEVIGALCQNLGFASGTIDSTSTVGEGSLCNLFVAYDGMSFSAVASGGESDVVSAITCSH